MALTQKRGQETGGQLRSYRNGSLFPESGFRELVLGISAMSLRALPPATSTTPP
jgi:hypothetical protein